MPDAGGRDDVGIALGTFTAGLDSLVEYLDGLTESRADRRTGDSLQQHRLERAGQPLRDRVRAPRAERHLQPAGGVEPRRARLQRRRDPPGADDGDGRPAAPIASKRRSSKCTIGFERCPRCAAGGAPTRPKPRARSIAAATDFILGEGGFLLVVESAAAADGARRARLRRDPRRRRHGVESGRRTAGPPTAPASSGRCGSPSPTDRSSPTTSPPWSATANGSPELDRLEADAIVETFGGRSDSGGLGERRDRRIGRGRRGGARRGSAVDRRRRRRSDGRLRTGGSRAGGLLSAALPQPVRGPTVPRQQRRQRRDQLQRGGPGHDPCALEGRGPLRYHRRTFRRICRPCRYLRPDAALVAWTI